MRTTRRLALAFAFLLVSSPEASASPAFPGVVQETLGLGDVPQCTLCHTSPSGGSGTANTTFATYLKSRGLKGGDEGSLRTALQAMIGEKHDSDGDGVPDGDELVNGTDPSGAVDASVRPIAYGCGGAHVSPSPTSSRHLSLAVACAALAAAFTRRRRARGRQLF